MSPLCAKKNLAVCCTFSALHRACTCALLCTPDQPPALHLVSERLVSFLRFLLLCAWLGSPSTNTLACSRVIAGAPLPATSRCLSRTCNPPPTLAPCAVLALLQVDKRINDLMEKIEGIPKLVRIVDAPLGLHSPPCVQCGRHAALL